jgi:hypothetical protein
MLNTYNSSRLSNHFHRADRTLLMALQVGFETFVEDGILDEGEDFAAKSASQILCSLLASVKVSLK